MSSPGPEFERSINAADIDALVRFLPEFSAPGFVPAELVSPDGVFPYVSYEQSVRAFIQATYDHGWVISYDWAAVQEWAESLATDPTLLATTTIDDLRRLITLHVRLDRFSEGHVASMIRSGHLCRVLQRLVVLRATLTDDR